MNIKLFLAIFLKDVTILNLLICILSLLLLMNLYLCFPVLYKAVIIMGPVKQINFFSSVKL